MRNMVVSLLKRMSKVDWQLFGAFLVMIIIIVVVAVLFTDDEGSVVPLTNDDIPKIEPSNVDIYIPEKYKKVDWEEIGDLNEDKKHNVLDMIIHVQKGE